MPTELIAASVDRDTVLSMFRLEQLLRDSDVTQRSYDVYLDKNKTPPEEICYAIQRLVIKDHGFSGTDQDLEEYWSLNRLWRDSNDTKIKDAVVHIRFRKFFNPDPVKEGMRAPDARVFDAKRRKFIKLSNAYGTEPQFYWWPGRMGDHPLGSRSRLTSAALSFRM